MSDKDIKYKLVELGLTEYESKGYLSMLKKHDFTATELSRISEIPRTRVYEILQKLVQRGLCIEILGNIKKYKAVSPEIALNKLLEYQKAEFSIKKNLVKSISSTLQEQYLKGSNNQDPLDYIELLKDPKQVARRFMRLVSSAKKEILIFIRPPFSNPKKKLEKQADEGIEALQRDVTCKALYEISKNREEREWTFVQADRSAKAGEHSRIIEELPLKMAVFDGSKVIFAMEDFHPSKNYQTSLVIENLALAKSMKILFETLWEKGRDYHDLLKIK